MQPPSCFVPQQVSTIFLIFGVVWLLVSVRATIIMVPCLDHHGAMSRSSWCHVSIMSRSSWYHVSKTMVPCLEHKQQTTLMLSISVHAKTHRRNSLKHVATARCLLTRDQCVKCRRKTSAIEHNIALVTELWGFRVLQKSKHTILFA